MRTSLCLPVVALLCCLPTAYADKPGPKGTHKTTSPDDKFVFVMLSPHPVEEELRFYNEDHQKVVKAIRDVYALTGLYKNDGSNAPLWTVDWYAATWLKEGRVRDDKKQFEVTTLDRNHILIDLPTAMIVDKQKAK